MKKAYLLIYSDSLGTREEVKDCLNSIGHIIHWRHDMPNSFYLISESTAQVLSESIVRKLGKKRFLITEISTNKQGMLPRETWDLINKKSRQK